MGPPLNPHSLTEAWAKLQAIAAGAEKRAGRNPPSVDPEHIRRLHREAYQAYKVEQRNPPQNECRQTHCAEMFCSKAALKDLKPMLIREMKMELMHKGRYLILRVVEPCFKMSGIMALVEDPEGSLTILSLYNYIRTESTDVEALLPVGTIFALKEPYYKFSSTNSCVIRCDSPSDVFILQRCGPNNGLDEENIVAAEALLKGVKWKTQCRPAISEAAQSDLEGLRQLQLDSFKKKHYYDSIEVASRILLHEGLDDESRRCVLYLRSYAYHLVGLFEKSFRDLAWILDRFPDDLTALIMGGQTLYSLRRFDQAQQLFAALLTMYPGEEGVDAVQKDVWMQNCAKRLLEQHQGKYDVNAMMVDASHSKIPRLDNADYIGPVRFERQSGGSMKVLLTKSVEPGTLLMACKAYEIVYASELKDAASGFVLVNFKTNIFSMPSRSQLATKIALKIVENPSTAIHLYDLDITGLKQPQDMKLYADDVNQREPVANVDLIHRIVAQNALNPEVLDEHTLGFCRQDKGEPDAGLWILPSHIKHACDASASAVFVGDFMFVRAKYKMKAGDEVTIPYIEAIASYEERSDELAQRNAHCTCSLCRREQAEPQALRTKRASLMADFKKRFKLGDRNDLDVITRIIDGLKETYKKAGRTGGIQQLLYLPCTALGAVYLARDQRRKAAESFELALRALGFTQEHEDYLLKGTGNFSAPILLPLAPMTAIHVYHYYWNADEYDLAEKWYRIARGLDRLLHGGEEAVFKRLYHSFIML